MPCRRVHIQTDTSGDVRPGAKATGLAGAIVVPIFRGAEIVGTLGIGNRSERRFTDEEAQDLLKAGRGLASHVFRERPQRAVCRLDGFLLGYLSADATL